VFISLPVLAETIGNLAWRRYRFNRDQIISAMDQILQTPLFIVQERDVVVMALAGYRQGWGDFNDHLVRCMAQQAGAAPVFTFDQELLAHRGFQAP
jgi:predicted nucleic-acid-binding protein